MKTPVSYYGGKQTMLKHILPLVPPHVVYTESFAGGAALYWAKEPAAVEVLNDINANLINCYRVLKSRFNELKAMIKNTLHSREMFDFACVVYDFPQFFDPVTRAWALWVKSKMGFASKLDGTFGYDKTSNSIAKKLGGLKSCLRKTFRSALKTHRLNAPGRCASSPAAIRRRRFTLSIRPTSTATADIIRAHLTCRTLRSCYNCFQPLRENSC